MSTISTQSPGEAALEEAKFEMAAAAARTERQNRPSHLKAIAWALVIVATGALGLSTAKWFGADAELKKQEQTATRMLRYAARIKQLEEAAKSGTAKVTRTNVEIRAGMQRAAEEAGLGTPSLPTEAPKERRYQAVKSRWTYNNVKTDSPENILKWCDLAVKRVPLLEVYSISIRPEATQWSASVVFQRWESEASAP